MLASLSSVVLPPSFPLPPSPVCPAQARWPSLGHTQASRTAARLRARARARAALRWVQARNSVVGATQIESQIEWWPRNDSRQPCHTSTSCERLNLYSSQLTLYCTLCSTVCAGREPAAPCPSAHRRDIEPSLLLCCTRASNDGLRPARPACATARGVGGPLRVQAGCILCSVSPLPSFLVRRETHAQHSCQPACHALPSRARPSLRTQHSGSQRPPNSAAATTGC